MSQLYPVSIKMQVSQFNIETVQYITDMYFKGQIEGQVKVCITAQGTTLLFTNPQDVTYVELDTSVIEQYIQSVRHIEKQLSSYNPWDQMTDNSKYYLHAGHAQGLTTTGAITNSQISGATWNPNSNNP